LKNKRRLEGTIWQIILIEADHGRLLSRNSFPRESGFVSHDWKIITQVFIYKYLIDRFKAVTLFPDALVLQGLVRGGKHDETLRLVGVRDPGLKKRSVNISSHVQHKVLCE
jgi:hypothetical protein